MAVRWLVDHKPGRGPPRVAATWRARVDVPHWRRPCNTTSRRWSSTPSTASPSVAAKAGSSGPRASTVRIEPCWSGGVTGTRAVVRRSDGGRAGAAAVASAGCEPPASHAAFVDLSADAVDAAVGRVRARDPRLGDDAALAADLLTAGEGAEVVYLGGLQDTLWWRIPKRLPPETWGEVIAGAAALFDELGLDRYAELARSETTAEVLDAWANSPVKGHARALSARAASGVAAPDTELLAWGTVFGGAEAEAVEVVERALEAAVVAGDLVPGGRGWKAHAAAITERALEAPVEMVPGQSWLTLVTTERVDSWLRTHEPTVQHLRQGVVNRLLSPIDPPTDVGPVVEPMRWLLSHAVDGIALTQSGYLARALVLEGVDRFDWWEWDKPPRSEADVFQLELLRDAARSSGLVRKRGRTLSATAKAKALIDDPVGLWRLLAGSLGGDDEFDQIVGELVAMSLLDAPARDYSLADTIGPLLDALGWRVDGEPLNRHQVIRAVWDRVHWWRTIGVAEHRESRWDRETHQKVEPSITTLTAAGEATVLAYLRHRATRPRTSPYGG